MPLQIKRQEEKPGIDPLRRGLEGGVLKLLSKEDVKKIQETAEDILWGVGGYIFEEYEAKEKAQSSPLLKKLMEEGVPFTLVKDRRGGIKCDHERALEIFIRGGAWVNIDERIVYLSREMVRREIKKAPSRIVLGARDSRHDLILEGHRVYCGSGGAPTHVLRPGENTPQLFVLKDLIQLARVADFLPHIHFYLRPGEPQDLEEGEARDLNKVFYALRSGTKHVMAGYFHSGETVCKALELAAIIAGGMDKLRERPLLSVVVCWMVPPRTMDPAVLDVLIEVCRAGIPVALSSDPMMGATAPATQAGLLTQLHAEQLSGIVFTQLIRPGTPVMPGYVIGVFNMKSSRHEDPSGYKITGGYKGFLGGTPEGLKMNAVVAQLAHSEFLDVPVYNTAGLSDAKIPDIQSGMEKGSGVPLSALEGVNYIHHAAGLLEDMNVISYEGYIFDNENIGIAMEFLRPIEVNEQTLNLDYILRVGPGGDPEATFVEQPETLQFSRPGKEFYYPTTRVIDRSPREEWEVAGMPTGRDWAKREVERIIATHKPEPLPEEIETEIRKKYKVIVKDPFEEVKGE